MSQSGRTRKKTPLTEKKLANTIPPVDLPFVVDVDGVQSTPTMLLQVRESLGILILDTTTSDGLNPVKEAGFEEGDTALLILLTRKTKQSEDEKVIKTRCIELSEAEKKTLSTSVDSLPPYNKVKDYRKLEDRTY